jgi:transposase-like protein
MSTLAERCASAAHAFTNRILERDHPHLKQRLNPLRGFKRGSSADTLARGHALIRNLRGGFSALSRTVPTNLRLAIAWPQLAPAS